MADDTRDQILRELERLGWLYDPTDQLFHNGERTGKWEDVVGLVPTLSDDKEQGVHQENPDS